MNQFNVKIFTTKHCLYPVLAVVSYSLQVILTTVASVLITTVEGSEVYPIGRKTSHMRSDSQIKKNNIKAKSKVPWRVPKKHGHFIPI